MSPKTHEPVPHPFARLARPVAALCAASLLAFPDAASAQSRASDASAPFAAVTEGAAVSDGGMSRGVAWGDFDGDGLADLFVANTGKQASFLYRNAGGGRLVRVTDWAGASLEASSEGAAWVDYDGDGDLDLYVANRNDEHNFLFRNDAGTLVRVTDSPLVAERGSSTASAWADVDLDGDLDVFVARRDKQNDLLFANEGGGRFRRIAEGPIVTDGGDSRACGWADADLDGDPDLFVANAHEGSFFFRNDGNWRFTRLTEGQFVTNKGYAYGTSWADYDNDGDFDLFVAHVLEPTLLYTNDGTGTFAKAEGVNVTGAVGASKGNAWGDYDNDGDLDLYIANGTPDRANPNFLMRNDGAGKFARLASGAAVVDDRVSAGTAWADVDADGDLDLFVGNWGGDAGQNNSLYLNSGSKNRWIAIETAGAGANRFGVGARVRVRATIGGRSVTQTRQVSGQTGYGSQSELRLHFGLGDARRVEAVEIHWPSGRVDRHGPLAADRVFVATEGRGVAERKPRRR